MSTYFATVYVVNKVSKSGMSGVRVNVYCGPDVYTDGNGKATVSSEKSSNSIYVDGSEVYDGSFSSAPDPIVVYKG